MTEFCGESCVLDQLELAGQEFDEAEYTRCFDHCIETFWDQVRESLDS